jgi:hypothetical protein
MIQQGDGTMQRRENLGQCVKCETALVDPSECHVCGLRFGTQTRLTAIYGVVNDPNQRPSQKPSKNQKS